MSETVDACPECDTTGGIYSRVGDACFACRECGAEFETPNTRPAKHAWDKRGGLAGRLARASPDEVKGE